MSGTCSRPAARLRAAACRRRASVLHRCTGLGLYVAALLSAAQWGTSCHSDNQAAFSLAGQPVQRRRASLDRGLTARRAVLENPVRAVSETIDSFYKEYPQPPVLPMYRGFLIDFLTQSHLAVVDSRFKYNAIWALGFVEYYNGLMGSYDKMVGGGDQADKILKAMVKALGMEVDKLSQDADGVRSYASSTSPGDILKHMEGAEAPSDTRISEAFSAISSSLYSNSFSVGLFKIMELSGVELTKSNVEEWAKALKVTSGKATSDLDTYKMNKDKLAKAEEMLREIEIREKKKLAERLEAKAKALAEKAAAKKADAEA